jgi:hypothetical protein
VKQPIGRARAIAAAPASLRGQVIRGVFAIASLLMQRSDGDGDPDHKPYEQSSEANARHNHCEAEAERRFRSLAEICRLQEGNNALRTTER